MQQIQYIIQLSGLSEFRQPPPLLEGFSIPSQETKIQLHYKIIKVIDKEAAASAAVNIKYTADL